MPKQDVAVELYYDSAWHDLVDTDQVLDDPPLTITRGQGDESPAPRPSSITVRLRNTDDTFRTSNPTSPLYGKAGVNTPLRASVGGVVRGYAEASSWTVGQTSDFQASPARGVAWADVQGGGLLQRVNQWTRNVSSPLRAYDDRNLTSGVIGRWPLEDSPGAPSASSLVTGSSASGGTELAFGSQFRAPGSAPLADLGGPNSAVPVVFTMAATPATSTAWQFSTVERLPALDAAAIPFLFNLTLKDTTDIIVTYQADIGLLGFLVETETGTELFYDEATIAGGLTAMRLWTIQFTQNGANIDVALKWRAVGDSVTSSISGSYAGTVSPLLSVNFSGSDLPEGTTIGHVTAVATSSPDLAGSDRYDAFAGYPGERAAFRFARLCDENNLPYYVSPTYTASAKMGPQAPDSLAGQFREIEATEDALIFDHRTEGRLYMLCRADRFNQTPALVLDVTDDPSGLPVLPAEVSDDLPIHNIVTAKQRGGGDYTVEDSTSAMGTQDPPNGRGEYKQDVDVNVYDPANDLPRQASWWLKRGTVDQPRFPKLTINLNALGSTKIAEVEAVDVGDVIEIENFRENTIRLYVLGYTEVIGTHERMITFVCAPDVQFQAGVWDDTGSRWDSLTTTLKTTVNTTATAWTFRTASSKGIWSTTAEPYDVMIGGERVTVTTMGAASLVSGSYDQAATVTRSVNGVVKAHTAGDPIHVATPGRWAL